MLCLQSWIRPAYVVVQQGASSRLLPPRNTDVGAQYPSIGTNQHGSWGGLGLKPGMLWRENIEDERRGVAEKLKMTDVLACVEPINVGEAARQGNGQQLELGAIISPARRSSVGTSS